MSHLLGEAGELARAGDQRRAAHEGAAAVLAPEQPVLLEIAQRVAQRDAAYPEHRAEPVFGRDLVARRPFTALDHGADRLLDLVPERLRPPAVGLRIGLLAHRKRLHSLPAAPASAA